MFGVRRLSAGSRVALAVTVAVAVAVALLFFLAYSLLRQGMSAELDRTLLNEAAAYQASVVPKGATDHVDLERATRAYFEGRTGGGSPTVLLVRFADGRVLANSDVRLERAPQNLSNVDPGTAVKGFSTVEAGGTRYRVATVPLLSDAGRPIAVFQAAVPQTLTQAIAGDLVRISLVAGLLVVVLVAALSRLVARATLRPLHVAARTAEDITHSSLSSRVSYDGPADDVGLLVESLNAMLERLEAAFGEQRRLVADASHELRTPLTVVQGHLDVMSEAGGLDTEQQATLELVSRELRRMGSLVSDLLALAQLEAGLVRTYQVLDLTETVEDAVHMARSLGERRFEIRQDRSIWVRGHRDMLLQGLLIVLSNAVNHTADGGHITLTCGVEAGRASVAIADDGPGIPPEDLERIFDRFYRSPGDRRPQAGGGSGLGLAIARRLLDAHGGTLTAENRAEGGAVFRFSLPLATANSGLMLAVDDRTQTKD